MTTAISGPAAGHEVGAGGGESGKRRTAGRAAHHASSAALHAASDARGQGPRSGLQRHQKEVGECCVLLQTLFSFSLYIYIYLFFLPVVIIGRLGILKCLTWKN